jgi:hypothetical protein
MVPGLTLCYDPDLDRVLCVDLDVDVGHCGECFHACLDTEECLDGVCTDIGAGRLCHCDGLGSCTGGCLQGSGLADTCIVTDMPVVGDGFCTFTCSADGADDECQGSFPDGCCRDIGGQGSPAESYCVPAEFCGPPVDP